MKIPIEGEDRTSRSEDEDKRDLNGSAAKGEAPPEAPRESPEEGGEKREDTSSKSLEGLLEAKTREAEENYEQVLRLRAEFDNFRKRQEKEHLRQVERANETLVQALLPVLDNLERAGDFVEGPQSVEAVREGMAIILQQLKEVLGKAGLKEIRSIGEPFDPSLHEAIMVMDVEPKMENLVVDEMQKGYYFKDKVLRPAKVTVGKVRET